MPLSGKRGSSDPKTSHDDTGGHSGDKWIQPKHAKNRAGDSRSLFTALAASKKPSQVSHLFQARDDLVGKKLNLFGLIAVGDEDDPIQFGFHVSLQLLYTLIYCAPDCVFHG